MKGFLKAIKSYELLGIEWLLNFKILQFWLYQTHSYLKHIKALVLFNLKAHFINTNLRVKYKNLNYVRKSLIILLIWSCYLVIKA